MVADMSCRNPPRSPPRTDGGSIGFRSDNSMIAAIRAGPREIARGLKFWCGGRVSSFGLPLII
jgi:hypothetical protein